MPTSQTQLKLESSMEVPYDTKEIPSIPDLLQKYQELPLREILDKEMQKQISLKHLSTKLENCLILLQTLKLSCQFSRLPCLQQQLPKIFPRQKLLQWLL